MWQRPEKLLFQFTNVGMKTSHWKMWWRCHLSSGFNPLKCNHTCLIGWWVSWKLFLSVPGAALCHRQVKVPLKRLDRTNTETDLCWHCTRWRMWHVSRSHELDTCRLRCDNESQSLGWKPPRHLDRVSGDESDKNSVHKSPQILWRHSDIGNKKCDALWSILLPGPELVAEKIVCV